MGNIVPEVLTVLSVQWVDRVAVVALLLDSRTRENRPATELLHSVVLLVYL